MITRLTFLLFLISTSFINAQIYTPSGVVQGTSTNNNIGIGTSNTTAKLTIQAGPDGYATPLKAISIWGPNTPENSNSAQAISWDFAAAGSAALRCYRGSNWDTYMQFLTNSNSANGNNPQVRMHITGDGNIGIGTESIGSQTKLHVKESGSSNSIWRGRIVASGDVNAVVMGEYNGKAWLGAHNSQLNAWSDLIIQGGGGNVGIGTNIPTAKLETLNTTAGVTSFKTVGVNGYLLVDNVGSGENYYNAKKFHEFQIDGVSKMTINLSGKVGIGTTNPDEKLTVNGKIHAQEVRIDLSSPMTVPDYVFSNDYKLKSLQEVEEYIKQNSHLPEIPSAKEIEKNGLMLAEMNMSLLKKMEEMTLYMIDQNKKINELEQQNKRLIELENRLEKIETNSK